MERPASRRRKQRWSRREDDGDDGDNDDDNNNSNSKSKNRDRQKRGDDDSGDGDHQHQQHTDVAALPARTEPATTTTTNRTAASSLLPIILCLAAVLVFLRLLGLSRPPAVAVEHAQSHGRSQRFELHPERHIYRAPATLSLHWTVTSDYRRPDGVKKRLYLVNGGFPGPTVEARAGDRLVINVTNGLANEGLSIHWHGLHMRDANSMDGVAGITQCPIEPGASFVYDFKVSETQTGTFWYHSHSNLQRGDGLYGGLIIHRPAAPAIRGMRSRQIHTDSVRYGYEKEHLLLIGDWYHRPSEKVLEWYMRPGSYGNEPVPDSLLVNGAGHFNCSMAVPARPLDCVTRGLTTPELQLDSGVSHRLRIVNTGSLAGFTLHFAHGIVSVIQVDGGIDVEPTKRKAKSAGILYPGQRMDLVIQPPRRRKASSFTVELDPECFNYPNPALTRVQTFPMFDMSKARTRSLFKLNPWTSAADKHIDLAQVTSTKASISTLPAQADKTFVVYTKISRMARNENSPFGYFNHTSWRPQANPPYPLITIDRDSWDENQFSLSTGSKPVWIDFIVNNLDEGPHPFHLHGHTFFILSLFESTIGWGSYNPHQPHLNPSPYPPYDFSKALERDTVQIPRRGHAVLRLRADNPGVWLFHCHILWHLASGMAMLLEVMNEKGGNGMAAGMEACRYVY
ncbi:Multicopper oxidase family protein [Coccidioides posadasii C735 delta SOWgp]|nr:Multicopper oxidase family protein [Coccidioides posadasii C735 delta SOWgp]EER24346.1 Multicopper oxidase family protein [Coccidioides posadasii C735 delta SOWgp]|eukprot:XP_003066491.1 Multicopper oxidase family protein [Coccidioides posadasii C735 delta SOWgp]